MMDEIYDRGYQSGRAEFHKGLDRAFGRVGTAIGESFAVLNRIQFAAPWAERRKRTRTGGCA